MKMCTIHKGLMSYCDVYGVVRLDIGAMCYWKHMLETSVALMMATEFIPVSEVSEEYLQSFW